MTYLVPRMSPAEGEAWLGLIKVCELLPNELDSQLQREASLTHFEFQVLTFLRWSQNSTASMSEIADQSGGNPTLDCNRQRGCPN